MVRGSVAPHGRVANTEPDLSESIFASIKAENFQRSRSFSMISTMSYPYQYVEYHSTPTTPHASPWEVDQSHPELFVQDQQQQAQPQPQPQQQPQLQVPQAYEPHPTIQLQEQPLPEPERIVPSQLQPQQQQQQQQRHEQHATIQLYPVHEGRSEGDDGGDAKPRNPLVDTSRHSISPAGSSTMPIRRASTRPHLQLAHPYRRPQSATGGSTVRPSRERQHVRFASASNTGRSPTSSSHVPGYSGSAVGPARCVLDFKSSCFRSSFSTCRASVRPLRVLTSRPRQDLKGLSRVVTSSVQMFTSTPRVRSSQPCSSCQA